MISIRPATRDDTQALYALSLVTGDAGQDAAPLYTIPTLMGDIYSVPYLRLEPELAFVAEDADGAVGFALGTANTRAFEARIDREYWPPLRARLPKPGAPGLTPTDTQRLGMIHAPMPTPEAVVSPYPAHMHINLVARARGQGVGRRLFDTFLAALPPLSPPGLHIGARADNADGIAFWGAMGFVDLEVPHPRSTWMGRSTQADKFA